MGTFLQDAQYYLRTLRKSPGFAAVVVLTLALGIGANTAIFSIVDAVLLRALPFPEPQRLVRVVDNAPGAGLKDIGMSQPELEDLQNRSGVFENVSAIWPIDGNITGAAHPERVEAQAVSANYFSLLGVHAQIGRMLGPEDRVLGFAETAVISDDYWRNGFGADPNILGKKIRLDGDAYAIVGVTPPNFRHPGRTLSSDVQMWVACGFAALPFQSPPVRAANFIPGAIGRLKPGMSMEQAQARLDSFSAQLREQYPNDYRPQARFSIQIEPLKDSLTGNVRPMLLTLLAAVAMMLLIGCANIANLLMVRAAGRGREIALRQSLGATKARLVRQMITESIVLAGVAGIVGIAAAAGSLRVLLYLVPSKLPRLAEITIDTRVLLFAAFITLLTGVLFGLAPAFEISSLNLGSYLKEGGRGAGGSRRQNRASAILVTAEFAICLTLMIGAGLLVRSFWKLAHADPGFNAQNAIAARIWLPVPNDPKQNPYPKREDRAALVREVLRRVQALPGVTSAAMSTSVPLSRTGTPGPITVEARVPASESTLAEIIGVSPDYFRTLETPLIQGRFLTESDQPPAPNSVLVDRTAASRFWPGQSPIGRRVKIGRAQNQNPWAIVVGVVGDIRNDSMSITGIPHLYFSIYQQIGNTLGLEVRSAGDPSLLGKALLREIQSVDPNLPVFGIRDFESMVQASVMPQRFSAQLMAAFAGLALLLAAVGIYGVLAYFVGQRTREIGVRMALGAEASAVIRLVLAEGLRPIAIGMAIGLAASLAFSRALSQLVYDVSTYDPLVFITVPVFLAGAALLASYLPARQATRIDPMVALRAD
jgi:predicted permease